MIQPDRVIVEEQSASMPAVPFRPESEGGEVGDFTESGPSVRVLLVLKSAPLDLLGEVEELRAVRGEVTSLLLDSSLEPLTCHEGVRISVPLDDLNPLTRPTSEDHAKRNASGQYKEQAAGRKY
jgi:hypothetical protein